MCSKQGKPSVPVHLTLMPSSSVGRNSDPFLGLPVLLEHSTSAWHKCQPKKLPPKKLFDTLVFEGKSNSKWWLTFLPTPNPSTVCALEGSQHCHLAVWSIEGTDLILSPLTQHDMQKITWAIANADVKSGKPYVCGFIDRSKKDEQGKSATSSVIEYWHQNEAGILLSR